MFLQGVVPQVVKDIYLSQLLIFLGVGQNYMVHLTVIRIFFSFRTLKHLSINNNLFQASPTTLWIEFWLKGQGLGYLAEYLVNRKLHEKFPSSLIYVAQNIYTV